MNLATPHLRAGAAFPLAEKGCAGRSQSDEKHLQKYWLELRFNPGGTPAIRHDLESLIAIDLCSDLG